MQELLNYVPVSRAYPYPDLKMIAAKIKWVAGGVWKPIRWLLEAMFVQHPAQRYIEESRDRLIRLIGHF